MYYDDGYEQEIKLEKAEMPKNAVRAYRLCNGDIFTVKDLVLQFENNILYEMVEDGLDMFRQRKWKRTGKLFTPEQLNKLIK